MLLGLAWSARWMVDDTFFVNCFDAANHVTPERCCVDNAGQTWGKHGWDCFNMMFLPTECCQRQRALLSPPVFVAELPFPTDPAALVRHGIDTLCTPGA